jgi:hypothetical protein
MENCRYGVSNTSPAGFTFPPNDSGDVPPDALVNSIGQDISIYGFRAYDETQLGDLLAFYNRVPAAGTSRSAAVKLILGFRG